MTPSIFFKEAGHLIPLSESEYEQESILQDLLSEFPELLVNTDSGDGGYVHIGSELPFDGAGPEGGPGFIDHVFAGDLGVPTLIEVKRSSDPRIRREVVGQMLDYASSVRSQWEAGYLRARFESLHENPDEELKARIASATDANEFWDLVDANIDAGKLRILFVADSVPDSLRRIIEFLNEQMQNTEVLAIEVKQFVDAEGERQALVPTVVGQTQAARSAKSRSSRQWDEQTFFERLDANLGSPSTEVARKLFEWANQHADLSVGWGRGKREGSMQLGRWEPYLWPVNVYTEGSIEFSFASMSSRPPFDSQELRKAFMDRLNAIDGVAIDPERIAKRPNVKLETFDDGDRFAELIAAIEWALDQ